jgi:putative transposase
LTNSSVPPALTDTDTLKEVIGCLTEHISVETQGACDQETLFNILVRAASLGDSIENTAKSLKNVPTSGDIRYHLEKINNFKELESQLNKALKSRIPPRFKNRQQRVAIDLNLIPYYGEPSADELPYIYRSKAKDGTCSFYAYATLYVIKKGKRVTLAIRGVRSCDTNVAIITYLLAELCSLKLKIHSLYLDRGFFSASVIRWLKALDIPFKMPAIVRGKQGGIRQLLTEGRSYKATYTMESSDKRSATFNLWIICTYKKGKRGQHGIEYFTYVVHKIQLSLTAIHQDYRRRFGIESSYRLKNQCRIRTTTKKPGLRLLFVGLAFLIVNIWIYLLWHFISQPRQGGRLIYRQLFGLKQMKAFLRQAVDRIYQVIEAIYLPSG